MGGRGSAKSSFFSVEVVLFLLRHPDCHAAVFRKVGNTLRPSVYAQVCWAIAALGLGLMQERINDADHDMMGCDGWEISAHANSAPDHEPFQDRQYSDAEYQALNNSLVRRIGTLNCGHAAFPIILGVSSPQYTREELEKLRADNAKGVTVNGKHYTGYEATQKQRRIERAIRKQKWRIAADEAAGDSEQLLKDKTRLAMLRREYREFSKAAGLRQQSDRLFVATGSGKQRGPR